MTRRSQLSPIVAVALVLVAMFPGTTLAADPISARVDVRGIESTSVLADGTVLVLNPVERRSSADFASGSANAGCQLTAYDAFGFVIYSYTIWQSFDYTGTVITYFPPESTSSVAYWGWAITSDTHSHWWVSNPTRAAARGNYTFTQYVGGQPFQSRSGWVQVNIAGTGSWTCSSS